MRFLRVVLSLLGFCVLSLAAGTEALAGDPASILPIDTLAQIDAGERMLIDVRTPAEWKATGVPEGAVTINLNGPGGAKEFVSEVFRQSGGDKARPLAVICRSGHRSAMAWQALHDAGFTDVVDVKEGVEGGPNGPGWIKRGLPMRGIP